MTLTEVAITGGCGLLAAAIIGPKIEQWLTPKPHTHTFDSKKSKVNGNKVIMQCATFRCKAIRAYPILGMDEDVVELERMYQL